MAVTNNATLIEDHETAPTYTSVGGGQGAASDADFVFIGSLASSRRMDNVTKNGFWFTDGTTHDLTAADTHVKLYMNSATPSAWTDFWIRLGSDTSNYEEHAVGVSFYPNDTGGWTPVWVDVDAGTDTGTPVFSAIDFICVLTSMNDIASNLKNFSTDQAHYSARPVLSWTGTGGDLDDFVTTDSTNGIGAIQFVNGVYVCRANFEIGTASTSATFTQNNATISWPDAPHLPSTSKWHGVDIDTTQAATDIDLKSNVFQGAAGTGVRRPDFLLLPAAGGSGALDISSSSFLNMREIHLNNDTTAQDCTLVSMISLLPRGADIRGSTVTGIAGVDRVANEPYIDYNENVDPDGDWDNITIINNDTTGANRAIQFGTSTPTTMTLRGVDFQGFDATAGNEHFRFQRDSGTVTLNLVGCTTDHTGFEYSTAGATITIVEDPVTYTVTVRKLSDNTVLSGIRVLATAEATGPLPYQDSVTITRSGTTASVSHTGHGLGNGDKILISGADQDAYNGVKTISNATTNAYDYTVSGSPTTPATGTIIATAVIIDGTTNGSGVISDTRTYGSNQDVAGRARSASGAGPYYKTGVFSATISSTAGASSTVLMASDE